MRKVEIRATLWIEPDDPKLVGPTRGEWARHCKAALAHDIDGIEWQDAECPGAVRDAFVHAGEVAVFDIDGGAK